MRKLSLILIFVSIVFWPAQVFPDSPHGKDFKVKCELCHSAKGWKLDREIYAFEHNKTVFPLTGQHQAVDCRSCHLSLVFTEVKTICSGCHTDIHEQTLGNECSGCHNTGSWIVNNISEIHQRSRFPLLGPHNRSDCSVCHKSSSLLRFDPLGIECIDCHRADYEAANQPSHVQGNFSTNCTECHSPSNYTWTQSEINHSFFPLTQGHAITCDRCHPNGNFTNTPNTCVGCHLSNYNSSSNPNHVAANIPTTCADCHTTLPGWKPARFDIHNTYYPLTGKHATITCDQCHNGNYSNIPNTCVGCHQVNFNQTTNPNHTTLGISTDCATCHTTNPGWIPALFLVHNNYWVLTGAHANITNCELCHNGNYNTAPNTCVGCHQADYNQTTNPAHATAQFPTDCQTCHTQTAWSPSTFNHDGQYFPIYSGRHQGRWTLCSDCHPNPANFQVFTCTTSCHLQSQMNNSHSGVSGYSYSSAACYQCHPTGGSGGKMKILNNNRQR